MPFLPVTRHVNVAGDAQYEMKYWKVVCKLYKSCYGFYNRQHLSQATFAHFEIYKTRNALRTTRTSKNERHEKLQFIIG